MAAATEAAYGLMDAQMQQQMQAAMLQMAQGMAGGGMPPQLQDSMAAAGMGGMPPVDPAMAQVYMQHMFQYLQQAAGTPPPSSGLPGMPSMPFLGMSPYAAPGGMGGMPSDPLIAVSVEGMKFQYQLTDDDLLKVFSRYGSVKTIRVEEAGAAAQISFHSFNDAQAAMNDLNGKVLNGLDGTLRISWINGPGAMPPSPYPSLPFGGGWGMPPAAPAWPGMPDAGAGVMGAMPGGAPPAPPAFGGAGMGDKVLHQKGVRKYTCRFLIGIENDKEFQVARRIIGAKGANMKRIVRQTEAKLRLRGMGSGYFEGAGQKESAEPLQLCVSCTSAEGYKTSVKQVEELLKRVYEDYKQFCRDNGRPVPDLQINLSENQLVYSSRNPGGPGSLVGGAPKGDDDDDDGGSPKKDGGSRRGRRSRAKESTRNANGEIDRGEPGPNVPLVEEIEKFIDDRNEARRANNFPEADRIRELLHSRGVALMDEPGGRGRGAEVTTWRYWRD